MSENISSDPVEVDNYTMSTPPTAATTIDSVVYAVYFWLGVFINSLGIFGNSLVITAILMSKRLRKTHNAFMASLSVCDLGAILFCNVLQIDGLREQGWLFDNNLVACAIQNMSFFHFNMACMVHVVVIAAYRYLAVTFPHGGLIVQGKKFVAVLLVGTHGVLVALAVVPKISRIHQLYYSPRLGGCVMKAGNKSDLLFLWLFAGGTVLSGSVVLVVYQRIRSTIMRHNQAMPNALSVQRQKGHLNIVICMALVLLVVILSYAMLSIQVGIEILGRGRIHVPPELGFLTIFMMWIANSTNWIIYGMFNRDFRQAYKELLSRRCGSQVQP